MAKKWLEGDRTGVKSLYTRDKTGRINQASTSQGIGARQIADFLSKNGKTISHMQIAKYLNIAEKLIDEIHHDTEDSVTLHQFKVTLYPMCSLSERIVD